MRSCQEAGLAPDHVIAMQGPFSREMNTAMLRAVGAKYLVTKDAGGPGGFEEKAAAARDAGAVLVVVGRPPQREGLDFSAAMALLKERFGLRFRPRVTLAGIGPGGAEAMTGEVRRAMGKNVDVMNARVQEDYDHSDARTAAGSRWSSAGTAGSSAGRGSSCPFWRTAGWRSCRGSAPCRSSAPGSTPPMRTCAP